MRGPRESSVAMLSLLVGAVGAAAAVAVFFIPAAQQDDVPAGTRPGDSPTTSVTTASGDSPASPPTSRALSTLKPETGVGLVTVKGDDLVIACPSNQGDDRFVEVRYALPSDYVSLAAQVSAAGTGDQEATVGVQVFRQFRDLRSDRDVEAGRSVVSQASTRSLRVLLQDAVGFTLRITCTTSTQQVVLGSARVER